MKFKILSLVCFLMAVVGMNAQTPMPLNPKVKHGVLPNGMSYYIMHNEEPKERANFYIAQKVGSTLEEPTQLGLAHFLEHMAFNGTTHYPGKTMLEYLQSKGIRFGADINAYTAFDETVYNINNVPTTDKALMDSVLLVLHDWSGDILLEGDEIDAERGVINGEYLSRNNASFRMYSTILPQIYEEYQYQQMPIGKMEVVMNFPYEELRSYYKKWYRPDQQGIVIVGDFDANEMEQKVIALFSEIVMPENAAPRTYPEVSDNEQPIFASYEDPELQSMMTMISFKSEKIPFEFRNTIEAYVSESIIKNIAAQLFNNRLADYALNPDCQYANSGVTFGNYYISKTKSSFDIIVVAKTDSQKAVEEAMGIVTQACKTGFTQSEYDRATQELMANLEKLYAERDKTNNDSFGTELCRYFIDNEAAPGIETEYQIWSLILNQLPVEEINSFVETLLTDQNMVVVTSAPKKDGFQLVSEQAMLSSLDKVMHAEYEALAEETIDEPLIPSLPAPGSIVSSKEDNSLGITELTLSNGARVILKPTDFAGDEILLMGYRRGGIGAQQGQNPANVMMAEDVYNSSKLGNFDAKTLRKYLAGKNVSLDFSISNFTDVLQGNSTVKDLPYLFELIYASFTELNEDEVTFQANVQRARPGLENQEKNPRSIFFRQVVKTLTKNNPYLQQPTVATLDNVNYSESLEMVKNVLGNAAEYTFIFTGNIDMATIKPLIEQYIASLPASGLTIYETLDATYPEGQIINDFNQPMEVPTVEVYNVYSGKNLKYNMENSIMMDLAGDILGNIYIDTLREEEGGTYSPMVGASYNPFTEEWTVVYYFTTNSDQKEKLIVRANDEWNKMLKDGVSEVNFNKVKEAMIKQYEINSRKNAYWSNALINQMLFPDTPTIVGYEDALKKINLKDFNKFLKNLYDGKNRIQVIMEGTPVNN